MLHLATLVSLNEWTNRTFVLPLAVFFPTSRCNSRCVSCDWWKASGEGDLTLDEIDRVAEDLSGLGTRVVLFSGGEPLLRPEVFEIADLFVRRGMTLHLHSSGVLLERLAARVADTFSRVIVSLDSPDEAGYRAIRGVAALPTLERGVARLRELQPELPVTARATLHRFNFRELPRLIDHARAMSLDGISFLAADVSAGAFGRRGGVASALALDREQIVEFADIVERTIAERPDEFAGGFVAEPPEKLRRLPQYYAALAGLAPFPAVSCNAPYASVVIEADGAVRPCFFHEPIGSLRERPLRQVIEKNLRAFRAALSMTDNPVCERCVCSMRAGWRSAPWR
ncbi:MAG TPA: radical SAM protein [Vicinamibacterales bacterium]|nr:radical SAM protein [Vicinamibacterales bacterium]